MSNFLPNNKKKLKFKSRQFNLICFFFVVESIEIIGSSGRIVWANKIFWLFLLVGKITQKIDAVLIE